MNDIEPVEMEVLEEPFSEFEVLEDDEDQYSHCGLDGRCSK